MTRLLALVGVLIVACGRPDLLPEGDSTHGDAGARSRDAGTMDGGVPAPPDSGAEDADAGTAPEDAGTRPPDAGVLTGPIIELRPGSSRIFAIALHAVGPDTLVTWVEQSPSGSRLKGAPIDRSGQWKNLTQTVLERASYSSGSLLPDAFADADGGVTLTGVVGEVPFHAHLSSDFFTQSMSTPDAGAHWARGDATSMTLWNGVALFDVAPGTIVPRSAPPSAWWLIPSRGDDTTFFAALHRELAVVRWSGSSWSSEQVTASTLPANVSPSFTPLVLHTFGPTDWMAVWTEANAMNQRRVDVRMRRRGGRTVTVAADAQWIQAPAALVATATDSALVWGAGARLHFKREHASQVCEVASSLYDDPDAIAMTQGPSGELRVLWAERDAMSSSSTMRHRLRFRVLGPDFCR
jgi:hypothetical protein